MAADRRTALLRLWRTALEWQRVLPADDTHDAHIAAVQARVFAQEKARKAQAADALTPAQAAAAIGAKDPGTLLTVVRDAFPAVAAPGEAFESAAPTLDQDAGGGPFHIDVVGLRAGELDQLADILFRLRRVGIRPAQVRILASPEDALRAALAEPRPDLLIARGLMPGLDGPWLVDEIRRAEAASGLSRLQVFVMSSAGTYLRAALQAGADQVEWLDIRPERFGASLLRALGPSALPPGASPDPDWTDRASAMAHLLACADALQQSVARVDDALLPWRAAYEANALAAGRRLSEALDAASQGGLLTREQVARIREMRDVGSVSAAIDQALRWPSPTRVAPPAPPIVEQTPATDEHDPTLSDDAPVIRVAFADGEDGNQPHVLLRRILERRGRLHVEHTSAEWGVQAIELAFTEPRPDLLILHQLMAWKAGDAVIREVRRREAEGGLLRLPIVAWDNRSGELQGCRDAGADLVCDGAPGPQVLDFVLGILGLPPYEAPQPAP
jgi:CheY-like chemotaxis protein